MLALVPHQDDELLIMGPACATPPRGRPGSTRPLRPWRRDHRPHQDMPRLLGYEPTGEEIGRVRDREFAACAAQLGLPPARSRWQTRVSPSAPSTMGHPPGRAHLDPPDAVCRVWVVSEFDANPDHMTMGQVVRELWAGARSPCRPRLRRALAREIAEAAPLRPETGRIGYWEQAPLSLHRHRGPASGGRPGSRCAAFRRPAARPHRVELFAGAVGLT